MNMLQKFPLRQLSDTVRANQLLMKIALSCIPDVPGIINVADIGRFKIRYRRNRSFWLRDPVMLEKIPLSYLKSIIKPGDVVYDVGANVGLYVRFEMDRFAAGQVIAFEPMDENRKLLMENIQLSERSAIASAMSYALADFDGQAEFQVDDVQSATATLNVVTGGRASLGRRQLGLQPLTRQVQCRRIDTLIAEGLVPPDVIKIDVEGAEQLVLNGAEKCLRNNRPSLVVELHSQELVFDVCRHLLELDYYLGGEFNGKFCKIDEAVMEEQAERFYVSHVVAVGSKEELQALMVAGI